MNGSTVTLPAVSRAVPAFRARGAADAGERRSLAPALVAALAFAILFWTPARTLVTDWWTDPESAHGLLLAPLAGYLAWKRGLRPASPARGLGIAILVIAVLLRFGSALAAEYFTMRLSMLAAVVGLIVYYRGVRQVLWWWLPFGLLLFSIPLPQVVLGTLALPLQFKASQLGTALLHWRDIPVRLQGNVILLPGQTLFVTEACSGLRSLTALLALGLLIGGLWLTSPVTRAILIALAVPVAVFLNGIRVFLTGFLVVLVDPRLGEGVMHLTEGWVIFVVAFAILGAFAWVLLRLESLPLWRRA